jgi:hypothetical protein
MPRRAWHFARRARRRGENPARGDGLAPAWHMHCCSQRMETLTPIPPAHRPHVDSRRAGSWFRAGVCAVGLTIAGVPAIALAAPDLAPSSTSSVANAAELPPQPVESPARPTLDPTLPREPNPTGIELPDEVTANEMKGQYGVGLGLLILGGIVIAGVVIGLSTLLMRRSWSEN